MVRRIAVLATLAGLLAGCGRLLALEVGTGYAGGWDRDRGRSGVLVTASIGTGHDRSVARGWACGLGGGAVLDRSGIDALGGGGAFRWDGTLGAPDPDAVGVVRWSFALEGFGAATIDDERLTLGLVGFTGPTWALLTDEGMGIAISAGPWNLFSIQPAAYFGGQVRLRITLGPMPGRAREYC